MYNEMSDDVMIYFVRGSSGPHMVIRDITVVYPDESWGDAVAGDGRSYSGQYHTPLSIAELKKLANGDAVKAIHDIMDEE